MRSALVPPKSISIPAIDLDQIDAATFQTRYVDPGRPVLLRGAMKNWAALGRWQDPEYLAEAAGERVIYAADPANGDRTQLPLKDLWRGIFAEGGAKFSSINASINTKGQSGILGNLTSDTKLGPFLPHAHHVSTKVFAGYNTRCGLHLHPDTEAYLCQVVGKKRVILFPPDDWNHIYPANWYSPYVSFSKAHFARDGQWPDFGEFPQLAKTHPMECVVEPGDMLYIPIYWWHVVWGLGAAICVTQFFRSSLSKRFMTRSGLRCNYLNRVGGMRLRLQMRKRGLTAGV